MEKIYEQAALELGLQGWEEQRNVVADGFMRAVWKKKGDVGEWVFTMEYEEEKHGKDVLCGMSLNIGRKFGARCAAQIKVLSCTGVEPILKTLNKGVERLINQTLGGGEVWQDL